MLHPDFRFTNYLLSWGWNATNAGGNKICWLTWNQQLLDARERGLKLVSIDPRIRGSGTQVDRWLPIKPGTDLAFALALCNLVIRQDTIDRDYLTKHSNSPYLVQGDGHYVRRDDVEQVWDTIPSSLMPRDAEGIEPALEGAFTVDGIAVRTAFQVFKEHASQYTPRWAAGMCGLTADGIREVARELDDNAMIGSTIMVDGVEVPYRPVGIVAYHVAQQEMGFQALRTMCMLMMMLGSMGAAGGQQIDFSWKVHKNYEGLDKIEIDETPNIHLNKCKFWPINSNNSSVVAKVMQDPGKYDVDFVPDTAIIHMVNPLASFASAPDIVKAYKMLKFVAVIDPWLSKTADMFADIVLPAATIEKYEGPLSATDAYIDATALRIPPIDPMFESRGEIDIYLDLCERAGMLTGEGGYLDEINKALKLDDDFALPLNAKPTVRGIFDRWAKSDGTEEGIEFYEREGIKIKGPFAPTKRYGYVSDLPFGGAVHRLYGESLQVLQEKMIDLGVPEMYWQDYTALPTWRNPTMNGSPAEYDLNLIGFKLIEFKQGRVSMIPLLAELAPEQRLDINSKTARAKGIEDGDRIKVESHNAVTNETRVIETKAHFRKRSDPTLSACLTTTARWPDIHGPRAKPRTRTN